MNEAFRQNILATIEKHGHQLIGVFSEATQPTFTYTIGLTATHGHELLLVGLRYEYAGTVLNDIAKALGRLELDTPFDEFTNLPLMLKRCTKNLVLLHENFVVQADSFYGRDVNVLQVVMCDREGHFPGDAQYDRAYMDPRQPLFF